MYFADLPTPGVTGGIKVQRLCAGAISSVQVIADTGGTDAAQTLHDFFIACAAAVKPLLPVPTKKTKE